jgi:DNA-binding NtrC family response regulator
MHILLVDYPDDTRDCLGRALQKRGHTVHAYASVEQAFLHLALADVDAAVINGEERGNRAVSLGALLTLRRRPARVVVTGTNLQTEDEVWRDCPDATFLLKPFLLEALFAALGA